MISSSRVAVVQLISSVFDRVEAHWGGDVVLVEDRYRKDIPEIDITIKAARGTHAIDGIAKKKIKKTAPNELALCTPTVPHLSER